jgi:hypothetical protein
MNRAVRLRIGSALIFWFATGIPVMAEERLAVKEFSLKQIVARIRARQQQVASARPKNALKPKGRVAHSSRGRGRCPFDCCRRCRTRPFSANPSASTVSKRIMNRLTGLSMRTTSPINSSAGRLTMAKTN